MKAIILAAGRGRRLTDRLVKEQKVMQYIHGRPMIEFVLDSLSFIPKKDTIIVVGYQKESVINGIGTNYTYVEQKEQLGTGNAVLACEALFENLDEDILVCYGDMPLFTEETFKNIIAVHKEKKADCTVLTASLANSGLRYGRVIIDEQNKLKDIIEYEDCNAEQKRIAELNVGVYVFKAKALFNALKKVKVDNSQGEYYLTDVPVLISSNSGIVETYNFSNINEIYGVNTPEEKAFCESVLSKKSGVIKNQEQNQRWFGTGGWRAIIGDEFIKSNICKLTQAVADEMLAGNHKKIVVGYDRRFLSENAAVWLSEVFAGNGIEVYFINRVAPTPLIMYTVKNMETYYGIAVTASHNPAEYNGIKIFTEGGKDAAKEVTDVFENRIEKGVIVKIKNFDIGISEGIIHMIDPSNDYMDNIIEVLDMNRIRNAKLKILIDPMYGVSKNALQTILMTARCDVDSINSKRDTLFGGQMPSPTEQTLKKLSEMVVSEGYDLGLATDGDADRIGVIDHNGRFVHPNEIMILLYYYLLKNKGMRGDCVRNIATTHILDKIAKKYGQTCYEVPVGFKHISMKMEETDAIIGGESSGGLTIAGHIKGKDGIFAAVLIAEMLAVTSKNIVQLLEEIEEQFGKKEMGEFDTKFSLTKKEELVKLLFEDKKLPEFKQKILKVSYEDGCKVYFEDDNWIIARFSGTEPLIRIFCEMDTMKEAKDTTNIMLEFLGLK